ncbi:MAG: hypothetical protein O7B35_02705 [Deltaproteobacteria bacterium]|nr:hypothetical protein [Deltaproteobacteria bacterium]
MDDLSTFIVMIDSYSIFLLEGYAEQVSNGISSIVPETARTVTKRCCEASAPIRLVHKPINSTARSEQNSGRRDRNNVRR